ncbi:aminoglycoside phosphotransferase [Pseudomonas sp. BN417]|uniref:phosphotransferase n=1 Tax=Pseudomonas sp. BN417 TaxID=2567890 RepID=UPI00245861AE|nr:phosphotransferase [Pseudomonas sp. BN417]MDH4557089.1 aminoglycoside phosphotransferase [Pseudomonas sp. BN417]
MSLEEIIVHDQLLQTAPAQVSEAEAAVVLERHFALTGRLERLGGERDLNFCVVGDHGPSRLLKLSHPLENPQVVDFHNCAMLRIQERDPELPVQRVYPALDGRFQVEVEVAGQHMLARLLSFVDGQPLHRAGNWTPTLRRNLGEALARFDRALEGFDHPAAGHELLWDMQHAARLRPLLKHIEAGRRRTLVEGCLDAFEEHALPRLPELRHQVIHNDLNPHNLIVDTEHPECLRNILDFGDMVRAPRVNDVAVAASYQLDTAGDVLAPTLEFISAYHAHNPLDPREVDVLPDLIATRLALTLCINAWRADLHPENRDYILRNTHRAWSSLERLADLPRPDIHRRIRQACRQEARP